MNAALALTRLLLIDLVFIVIVGALLSFLAKRKVVAFAVLKRNFLGYFSNPTGYVFLCLFVLLTSMAAFWPHEFFSSNLATLGQLNKWFPIIMLFFIPAITMSIWTEEKRQGTDELLLTLPADDFDIVAGKYLAAASIYTCSLLFSQISTFLVLMFLTLGDVDTGLFFANYLGYWFIGLAMLAIGMVASFLTSNLTVGFILGALFNAPLALAVLWEMILPTGGMSRTVKSWSIVEKFDSFGRGVLGVSSISYFVLIAVFGIYLCMVLIGRRHWSGGKESNNMFMHYMTRIVLMACIVVAGSALFSNMDYLHYDATEEQVSSLSPTTRNLVRKLDPENPIVVDAYVSADVPELYAKTRYNLITLLKEFESVAKRNNIPFQLNINDNLEVFSEEAALAEKQYNIVPQTVRVRERGVFTDQQVILGAAFRSGLEKVVVPFFETGVPVEYELVRSLRTVSKATRKKLGVAKTEASMMGGASFAGGQFQQIPRQPIIDELSKQYEVEEVDLNSPILVDQYDALLVVQPSSLSPPEMNNLIDGVRQGIPTAIFEDPMPYGFNFPGTGEPKQPPGGMFGGGGAPQPKGDIQALWQVLGLDIPRAPAMGGGVNPDLCWQRYNPYPKLQLRNTTDEWIFAREEAPGADDALSEKSEITKGLSEIMFLYSGVVRAKDKEDFDFVNLVSTGTDAGTVPYEAVSQLVQSREESVDRLRRIQGPETGSQTVAMLIQGKEKGEAAKPAAEGEDGAAAPSGPKPIKAVYVADTDCMLPIFIAIRNRPEEYEEINFRLQNVTFLLNIIDVLSGEPDYPSVRRHEPQLSTLRLVEMRSEEARADETAKMIQFEDEYNKAIQEIEAENTKVIQKFQDRVNKLRDQGATDPGKQGELINAITELQTQQELLQRKLAVKREALERERDRNVQESRRRADLQIQQLRNRYKVMAICIPPIPPLLVGICVLVSRRLREREGISKNRLR